MALSSRVTHGVAAAVVGWAGIMAGCATGQQAQSKPPAAPSRAAKPERSPRTIRTVNSICPMSGLPVEADAPIALYRNVAVGFCCRRCLSPWTLLTDREKREILLDIAPDAELSHRRTPPRNVFRPEEPTEAHGEHRPGSGR